VGGHPEAGKVKPDGIFKHVILVFLIALAGYIGLYSCDRHLRLRKGPWQVTFASTGTGEPSITVSQNTLGIEQVRIVIAGEQQRTNGLPKTVLVDVPRKPVPFGKIIFDDLMYLPGTVVFDLFGHEVELLPRVLVVNGREHAWTSTPELRLMPDEKIKRKTQPGRHHR
jgi:hypothetical protein